MDCRLKFFQSGVLSGGSVSLKQQLAKLLSDCQLASKITLVLYMLPITNSYLHKNVN